MKSWYESYLNRNFEPKVCLYDLLAQDAKAETGLQTTFDILHETMKECGIPESEYREIGDQVFKHVWLLRHLGPAVYDVHPYLFVSRRAKAVADRFLDRVGDLFL